MEGFWVLDVKLSRRLGRKCWSRGEGGAVNQDKSKEAGRG
jgi:hypothetical protein